MKIQHHGAVNGVTGSCHQLHIDKQNSILIDCGLFQGKEQGKEQGSMPPPSWRPIKHKQTGQVVYGLYRLP